MAQTTGGISNSAAIISISTDAVSFSDISGYASTVEVSGGDQIASSQQVLYGDAALVLSSGKTEPYRITMRIVYTVTDGQPFDLIWDRFKGPAKTLCVRWSHAGASGDIRFTTTNAAKKAAQLVPIVSCTPPGVDTGTGEPVMFSFTVLSSDLLKTTI